MMGSHPGPTEQQAEEALRRTRAGDTKAFATAVALYELPIQAGLASVGEPDNHFWPVQAGRVPCAAILAGRNS